MLVRGKKKEIYFLIKEISTQKTIETQIKNTGGIKLKSSTSDMPKPALPVPSIVSTFAAQDKLSSSIVSFAKFFQLSLKPQVLANIRQQALAQHAVAQQATNSQLQQLTQQALAQQTAAQQFSAANINAMNANNAAAQQAAAQQAAAREALSLAAAAAESKGVELSPSSLETYTDAIDPDSRRKNSGGQNQERDGKNKDEKKRDYFNAADCCNAESLKKSALEFAQNDPLLLILNILPGKNGQRWIVLPINFNEDGKDFFVSIRILVEGEQTSSYLGFMALDVVIKDEESGDDNIKRQLFVIESAGDKIMKIFVYFKQELSKKERVKIIRELSEIFGISAERVIINHSEENFPFEISRAENMSSINEAV